MLCVYLSIISHSHISAIFAFDEFETICVGEFVEALLDKTTVTLLQKRQTIAVRGAGINQCEFAIVSVLFADDLVDSGSVDCVSVLGDASRVIAVPNERSHIDKYK